MWCKYTVFFMLLTANNSIFYANTQRFSGLYIDNGFHQTIAHQTVSYEEKRNVEFELLNILGLPNRPQRITRQALLVKRSAPKFLLNVYNKILHNTTNKPMDFLDSSEIEEFNLTGHDINAIGESDVIMTFGAHNPFSADGPKINRGKRIWFDLSEIPPGEILIAAELRLYRAINFEEHKNDRAYIIAVYRVSKTKEKVRIKYYVDATNVTVGQEGWMTLNITEALQHWLTYPKENRGLFLAIHRLDYSGRIMRPDDIGIVGVLGIPDKQPFMVGFFKSSGRREMNARGKRDSKERRIESSTAHIQNTYIESAEYQNAAACGIRTLYVNFKDLQWQDWIIAPKGYDAHYCSGQCNFPLNKHTNATNHAIVQTLVHLIKPDKVPTPCCAPTKLSPISVLYFLDDSNVILRKYKNMVVDSCGCR